MARPAKAERLMKCSGCGVLTLPEVLDDVSSIDPCGAWTLVCPECAEKVYADVAANEEREEA